MVRGRSLHRRHDRAHRSRPGRGPGGQRGRRPPGDQRLAEPGEAPAPARRVQGARHILEIGTLGGYSTIWLARALPEGGRLVTLESEPKHAEVARANIARAGLANVVDLRLGPALETLPQLASEGLGPFDLVFIDADKPSTPEYFAWALKLTRQGSLIIVDNVVRKGAVVDERQRRSQRPGGPPVLRDARGRAARQRHGDPDGGEQGVRRLRDGAGQLMPPIERRRAAFVQPPPRIGFLANA